MAIKALDSKTGHPDVDELFLKTKALLEEWDRLDEEINSEPLYIPSREFVPRSYKIKKCKRTNSFFRTK